MAHERAVGPIGPLKAFLALGQLVKTTSTYITILLHDPKFDPRALLGISSRKKKKGITRRYKLKRYLTTVRGMKPKTTRNMVEIPVA